MLNQIKKDLQHPFAPVKRRFKDGRIVFYYSTIKCFDAIPQDVKDNLQTVAEKYGGLADTFMGTISLNPLKMSFDCNLQRLVFLPGAP